MRAKVVNWSLANAKWLVWFLGGCLTGVMLKAPLLEWSLSDGASSVFGSGLASFVAVAGAAALTEAALNRKREVGARVLNKLIEPLTIELEFLVRAGSGWNRISSDDRDRFPGCCRRLMLTIQQASTRLKHLTNTFNDLGPEVVIRCADTSNAISMLERFEHRLSVFGSRRPDQITAQEALDLARGFGVPFAHLLGNR